jgi:uncharacterized protein YeaO (DUF488 family)
MTGTLYTSYFAKLKKGIGVKISVARYNPKWLNGNDIRGTLISLAPNRELLNDYKYKDISWNEYTERYIRQIKEFDRDVQGDIYALKTLLNDGEDVTIYCYEKPSDNCHRHILGDIFKEMGYDVKEIL